MTAVGTPLYQAPEVSRGERYGFAADVYSFAITMYELCKKVSRLRNAACLAFAHENDCSNETPYLFRPLSDDQKMLSLSHPLTYRRQHRIFLTASPNEIRLSHSPQTLQIRANVRPFTSRGILLFLSSFHRAGVTTHLCAPSLGR